MVSKVEKRRYKVNMNNIYLLFFVLVVTAKIIRYTIMKKTLVDPGVGHHMIHPILYDNIKFSFFESDSTSMDTAGNVISLFKILNIFKLNTYIQFEAYITIIWNWIILFLLIGSKQKIDIKQSIFLISSIVVLNIFDFTLAKEPIQMLYFIVIYLILISRKIPDDKKNMLAVAIIVFSAMTFRTYYFIIAMFAICSKFLLERKVINRKNPKISNIFTVIIYLGIIYFIVLNVCKFIKPDIYTELIRVRTRVGGAASDMINIFNSTNLVIFTIDYIIMLFRMLIPVELLPLGIKYLPYVVYQLMITYFLFMAIKNMKNNSYYKNVAIYIFVGFLLGSATFEPDFGSWVRHEAVCFPLLLIISDIKIKKNNNINLYKNTNKVIY